MELAKNHVIVELVPVETDPSALDSDYETLSESQRRRADRFRFDDSRNSFITAHGLARRRLATLLGMQPASVEFDYGAFGKPSLRQKRATGESIEFNLSHSGDWVALAICLDRAVGIDIERIRTMDRLMGLARRTFSPREAAEIELYSAGEDQHAAFFTCWTRNEASVKVYGLGLTMDLDKFNVSTQPGQDYAERLAAEHNHLRMAWLLKSLPAPKGYIAAIACSGHEDFQIVYATNSD